MGESAVGAAWAAHPFARLAVGGQLVPGVRDRDRDRDRDRERVRVRVRVRVRGRARARVRLRVRVRVAARSTPTADRGPVRSWSRCRARHRPARA